MAPRTASNSPRSAAATRSTRSTRNTTAEDSPQEKKKQSTPRQSNKTAVTAKTAVPKRTTRASRISGADEDGGSESGTDADKEDENNTDDDEPDAKAPSGAVTRKRGHQTGLSLTLSNTNLATAPRGTKRELSTSTIDEIRPNKAQKKFPSPPSQDVASENSEDDDDAYNAVNDISESGESDIERVEEQNIIESVEHHAKRGPSEDRDSWAGFTLDGIAVEDESPFFSENFAVTEPNSEIDLTQADNATANASPSPNSAPVRRVRFADVSSTSSSQDSDVDEAVFPDLILDQENLHPTTRQLFELDDDAQQNSDESYWDTDALREMPPPKIKDRRPPEESTDDFSGYETDSSSGQTTDEESVPLQTVHRPHTVLRLNAEAPHKAGSLRRINPDIRPHGKPGKGPSMGTWIADPTKPIGVIHPRTKRMVYLAPSIPALPSTGISRDFSSAGSTSPFNCYIDNSTKPWPRQPWVGMPTSRKNSNDSDSSNANTGLDGTSDFVTRSVATAMMNGLQPYPPIDTFYAIDTVIDDDEPDEDPDADDPDEALLDIEAFIDFGEDDSDSPGEGEGDSEELVSPITPLASQRLPTITPKLSRGRSSSQSLLEHFDKGVVSAFRRNQTRHHAVLRRPVAGTRIQAIKGGRQIAANAPITPIRKRKTGRALSSSMAPFTGINTSRLRSGTA